MTWIRPTTLEELLELKMKHPQAKLVIGNTEIGEHKTFFVPSLVFKCEHVTLKHALIDGNSNQNATKQNI